MRQELRVEKAPGHYVAACCFLLHAMMPSSKPCLRQHVVGSDVTQGVQHSYQIMSGPCKMCRKALSAAYQLMNARANPICTHVCKLFLLELGLCFLGQTDLTLLNLPGKLRDAASHAGGIPLLVAALDGSSRVAATGAHQVVSCLLDTTTILAEQVQAHEVMLWRMQGLHRYANLLCPLPVDEGKALDRDSLPGTSAKLLIHCFSHRTLTSLILSHTTYTCAFQPGCLMSHNWLHTPDCKVLNECANQSWHLLPTAYPPFARQLHLMRTAIRQSQNEVVVS